MAGYRPDFRDTARLMRSAGMGMLVIDAGFDTIPDLKAISPDAPPYGEGYVDSFGVDGGHTERIAGTKRAVAYLYNDSPHAAAVEWGNEASPGGHHILSVGIDMIEG